jgi:glycosyltransferase involved in cell wall biosynthesis
VPGEPARVDIGIPTLGRSALLVEAIESVLAQTVRSWRLVISENGPADPTLASTLRPYLRDARITHRATGRLLSSAANHSLLIRAGSAPYVALLHDDDVWDPTFLDRRLQFLDEHPTCGLVFSGTRQADASGRDLGRVREVLREGLYRPEDFVPILIDPRRAAALLPAPTVSVVRREAYEAAGPAFEESFPLTFDSEMLLRLAVRYPVGYVQGWDATYRLHAQQTSFNKHWGDELIRGRSPPSSSCASTCPDSASPRRISRTTAPRPTS